MTRVSRDRIKTSKGRTLAGDFGAALVCLTLTLMSKTRKLSVAVQVTTCRGRGYIVSASLRAAQLIIIIIIIIIIILLLLCPRP